MMSVERAQDVLMHKRLLQMAHHSSTSPAVEVQPVQVHLASGSNSWQRIEPQCYPLFGDEQRIHPPPAFDLLPNLKLALEANQLSIQNSDHAVNSNQSNSRPMHEITISTHDKPKLFNQLTSLLSEIGLNIQEAHAYSTTDGYSLDVFLVDGWRLKETEQLKLALAKKISRIENHPRLNKSIPQVGEKVSRINLLRNRLCGRLFTLHI